MALLGPTLRHANEGVLPNQSVSQLICANAIVIVGCDTTPGQVVLTATFQRTPPYGWGFVLRAYWVIISDKTIGVAKQHKPV